MPSLAPRLLELSRASDEGRHLVERRPRVRHPSFSSRVRRHAPQPAGLHLIALPVVTHRIVPSPGSRKASVSSLPGRCGRPGHPGRDDRHQRSDRSRRPPAAARSPRSGRPCDATARGLFRERGGRPGRRSPESAAPHRRPVHRARGRLFRNRPGRKPRRSERAPSRRSPSPGAPGAGPPRAQVGGRVAGGGVRGFGPVRHRHDRSSPRSGSPERTLQGMRGASCPAVSCRSDPAGPAGLLACRAKMRASGRGSRSHKASS